MCENNQQQFDLRDKYCVYKGGTLYCFQHLDDGVTREYKNKKDLVRAIRKLENKPGCRVILQQINDMVGEGQAKKQVAQCVIEDPIVDSSDLDEEGNEDNEGEDIDEGHASEASDNIAMEMSQMHTRVAGMERKMVDLMAYMPELERLAKKTQRILQVVDKIEINIDKALFGTSVSFST